MAVGLYNRSLRLSGVSPIATHSAHAGTNKGRMTGIKMEPVFTHDGIHLMVKCLHQCHVDSIVLALKLFYFS